VVFACGNPCHEDFFGGVQVDEVHEDIVIRVVERRDPDHVAVLGLEGRAGEDDALGATREFGQRGAAEGGEPVPTVGVREGDVCSHLINIGFGMVLKGLFLC